MDIKAALREFFSNPWLMKLPVASFLPTTLAALIHPALAAVGFELSAATAVLTKIGFTVSKALLPTLTEEAKKGVDKLADWLEQKMQSEPELNEAAAKTMVEQAPVVAEIVQETHPEDKDAVAAKIGEGMEVYGGATAEIATQYTIAMKDVAELQKIVEQMQKKVESWASQTVEARRESIVRAVEQQMEGKGGIQNVLAEDKSTIEGVKQTQNIGPASKK